MCSRTLASLALAAILVAASGCSSSSSPTTCEGAAAPLPVAGPDREVLKGSTVTLAGSAFGLTGPASYLWRLEAIPAGSQAHLGQDGAASTSFVADTPGTYVASLTVRDTCATSAPDMVVILVPGPICANPAPVASAGPDQASGYRTTVYLNGTGSHGVGGGPLAYAWTMDSRPPGSMATLADPTTVSPSFYPDRTGSYVISLVVNDGCRDSTPDSVTVSFPNSPPYVFSSPMSDAPTGVPVIAYASAVDPDGDPLTYAWVMSSTPAGSAASLTSPAMSNPTFTPDLPGLYVLAVSVSDGTATSNATVTVKAVDYPPVASAGADQSSVVGATVHLDGSASADANRTPMAFAWALSAPAGSAAVLAGADTALPTFVPDVPGSYRATLAVTSGGQVALDTVTVAVWPAVRRLSHRVVAAAYSGPLERIVMVAADPNALYLLDPATGDEATVALALAPDALALSPDGLSAAVGHAGAITSVDLVLGTAAAPVTVLGDVAELALGAGRVAWVVPRPAALSDRGRIVSTPLDGGTQGWVTSAFTGAVKVKLRPGASALYAAGGAYSVSLEHYDVSGALPVLVNSVGSSGLSSCGDLWFSQAGSRIFTRCGPVYLASSSWTEDLTAAGTLNRLGAYPFSIHHLADSTAAGRLSAITSLESSSYYGSTDDQVLRSWSAADLVELEAALLPSENVGGTSYRWGGRFVFYRGDGSSRYLLLQLDPAAGVLQDFGFVTF